MNRLGRASSPYLLQHRDNPVHWWEWGPEPFAEARGSNKPVLLSIGYAACHWCHVMAHESFEDPHVAAVMNELFVNIKVDREERPDVDHVYMAALQLLGQPGGWPLTMFLTPEGAPFWGGTYFPKQPGFGRPGFEQVLREVARVFHVEPARIEQNRSVLTARLGELSASRGSAELGRAELDTVGQQLTSIVDPVNGGLPGAPKFPNAPILEFLTRFARRTGDATARSRFLLSLERMALGGIHDHLGGGFARYAVDEEWLVPHFEKMLYDNAQLLELYALAAQETGRPLFRKAAEGIAAWLQREMTLLEGAFAASLDADQEGEEGRFYVWSLAEIRDVLGPEADRFAAAYDVRPEGNWEGATILNRLRSREGDPDTEAQLAADRAKLLARRDTRVRPGLDDKVLADWNGLTIAALVRSGLLLTRPDWIGLAERAYRFIADTMERDGILGHSWRRGALVHPGFALDHAAMIRAALALAEATGQVSYLDDARRWRTVLTREYRVPESGTLAMTAATADPLVVRPHPTQDEAVPNANGVFAEDLVRIAALSGQEDDRLAAEDMLARLGGVAAAAPMAHASVLNALDLHLRGLTVLVANDPGDLLRQAALQLPYLDRTIGTPGTVLALDAGHPAKRAAGNGGGPEAIVCAGMRCSLPVSTPDALTEQVRAMLAPAPAA